MRTMSLTQSVCSSSVHPQLADTISCTALPPPPRVVIAAGMSQPRMVPSRPAVYTRPVSPSEATALIPNRWPWPPAWASCSVIVTDNGRREEDMTLSSECRGGAALGGGGWDDVTESGRTLTLPAAPAKVVGEADAMDASSRGGSPAAVRGLQLRTCFAKFQENNSERFAVPSSMTLIISEY